MVFSTPTARLGLLRALARPTKLGNTTVATACRSLAASRSISLQQQQQQALLFRSASAPKGWSALCQQQGVQRRCLSGGKDDESDDDFKPKRKAVPSGADEVADLIKKQVESNSVMLYMKGTPAEPRCGFSAQVVRILHSQGVSFSSVNVLDYPPLREGIKSYSEWPTIPQVFVKGEFVGGCDIVSQLHESGELETMFKDAQVKD